MIGDLVIMSNNAYVKTNSQGTLECLPRIAWYRTLQIFWLTYWHKRSIGYIRDFYYKQGE